MKRDPRSPSLRARKGREGASACGTNISTCRTTAAARRSGNKYRGSQQENGCAPCAPTHSLSQGSAGVIGQWENCLSYLGKGEERRGRERGRGVAFSICLPTAQISPWNSVPFHTFTRNVARTVGAGWREECNDNAEAAARSRSPRGESLARSAPSSGSSPGRAGPRAEGQTFSAPINTFSRLRVRLPSARRAYLCVWCDRRSSLIFPFAPTVGDRVEY